MDKKDLHKYNSHEFSKKAIICVLTNEINLIIGVRQNSTYTTVVCDRVHIM